MKQTTAYLIRILLFAGSILYVQAADSVQERWINAAYVKNGTVDTGDTSVKLDVRSGPGLNYNQVDTLSSGQKVETYETKDGWIRIKLSSTSSALPPMVPVRPPVNNLILNGDFSATALALPTAAGDAAAVLSGRWLRSSVSAWEIFPYGGNLGPYARAAASSEAGRLLYVANDGKRSTGSYVLRFDYILSGSSDVLGVKVFVSDRDITVGTDSGDFCMNSTQYPSDMAMLPAGTSWVTYYLPVELGNGYNYVYVLFTGSGTGNAGIDNISLSPQRR